MRLCMVGHVPFYHREGRYYCTPGFARLLETLAPLFGRVDLCVPRFEGSPARGEAPVEVPNLRVVELPPYFRRWEWEAFRHPIRLMRRLWGPMRRSEAVWILTPNYLSLIAWALCLLQGKRFIVRVAGNWPELIRLGFRRIGHPVVGAIVAGVHSLFLHGMARTSAVMFVHGRDLLETFGRHNRRVVGFVSSTVEASDIGDRIAASPGAGRRILYAGAINFAKGLFELFEAFRRLREEGLDVSLTLAGGGGRQAEMRRAARQLGIDGAVHFLGWIPPAHLKRLYRSSDVLVMPSYSETGPKVVIEAMASGLPVVATRVGSVPIVVEHGKSGLIVPRQDADALHEALRRLLTDEALRRRMARRCLERAAGFTVEAERRTIAEGLRQAGFPVRFGSACPPRSGAR